MAFDWGMFGEQEDERKPVPYGSYMDGQPFWAQRLTALSPGWSMANYPTQAFSWPTPSEAANEEVRRMYGNRERFPVTQQQTFAEFMSAIPENIWKFHPSRVLLNAAADSDIPVVREIAQHGHDLIKAGIGGGWQMIADPVGAGVNWALGEQQSTRMPFMDQGFKTAPGTLTRTIGEMAAPIGATIATGMGASSWLATKFPALAGTPATLNAFGRAFAPAATWANRLGFGGASAGLSLFQNLSPMSQGIVSPGQAAAQAATEGVFGMFTAGQWGGSRVKNIIGDALVNTAGSGVSGLIPFAFDQPGYGKDQYLANLALGAGLGAAFGVAGNIQRQAGTSFGSRVTGTGASATPSPGAPETPRGSTLAGMEGNLTPEQQAIMQSRQAAAQAAFGEDIPIQSIQDMRTQATQRGLEGVQTAGLMPDGTVRSVSDAYLRGQMPEGLDPVGARNVAEAERAAYSDSLARMYPPETLVPLLELEWTGDPRMLGSEQLSSMIENEWLVQAGNGKGMDGVEARLAQAGLVTPLQVKAQAEARPVETAPMPAQPEGQIPMDFEAVAGEAPVVPVATEQGIPVPRSTAPVEVRYTTDVESPRGNVRVKATAQVSPDGQRVTLPINRVRTETPPSLDSELFAQRQTSGLSNDVSVWIDPVDSKPYVVDGVRRVEALKNGDLTSLPQTNEGVTLFDPNTGELNAKLVQGDPVTAAEERLNNNPDIVRTEDVEPKTPINTDDTPQQKAPVEESSPTEVAPDPAAVSSADKYASSRGQQPPQGEPITALDETRTTEIGERYLKARSPEVPTQRTQKAYTALQEETLEQAKVLASDGYSIEVWQGEGTPYQTTADMMADIAKNRHVFVEPTEKMGLPDGHPQLRESVVTDRAGRTLTQDELFRGVHAVYGHAARGADFDAVGVENAWDQHVRMYSPLGRLAMTAETRLPAMAEVISGKPAERKAILATTKESTPYGDRTMGRAVAEAFVTGEQGPDVAPLAPEAPLVSAWHRTFVEPAESTGYVPRNTEESVAAFVAGEEVPIKATMTERKGGRYGPVYQMIAEVEGTSPSVIARRIASGETSFAGDRFIVRPGEEAGEYLVRHTMDVKNIAKKIEQKRAVPQEGGRGDAMIRSEVEDIISNAQEMPWANSSMRAAQDLDVDIAETGNPYDDMNVGDPRKEYDKWRSVLNLKARNAVRAVVEYLNDKGTPVPREQVAWYILGRYSGIEPLAEMLDPVINRNVPVETRAAIDNAVADSKSPLGKKVFNSLYRDGDESTAGLAMWSMDPRYRESSFRAGLSETFDAAREAGRSAEVIAKSVGVEPDMVLDAHRLVNQEGKNLETSPYTQEELEAAYAKIVADPSLEAERSALGRAMNNLRGSYLRKEIFNNNIFGRGANYNWALRSFAGLTSVYAMDEYVDSMNDEETYFGIPGKVWKEQFSFGGPAGYAFMGLSGIPGLKGGFRRAAGGAGAREAFLNGSQNFLRRLIQNETILGSKTMNLPSLKAEEKRSHIERIVAEHNPTLTWGTPEFDAKYREYEAEIDAFDDRQLTVLKRRPGLHGQGNATLTTLRQDVPAVREFLDAIAERANLWSREVGEEMHKLWNNTVPDIRKRWGKQSDAFVDAMAENDYRKTAIFGEDLAPEELDNFLTMIDQDIKAKYFGDNEEMYADYLKIQDVMDQFRELHYKSLIAEAERVPLYELDSHLVRMQGDLNTAETQAGVIRDDIADHERRSMELKQTIKDARKQGVPDEALATLIAERKMLKGQKTKLTRQLDALDRDAKDLRKRIDRIQSIPDMVERSKRTGYLVRSRDDAEFILRVESADGNINVRREFRNQTDAERHRLDYMRDIASKRGIERAQEMSPAELWQAIDDGKTMITVHDNRARKIRSGSSANRALRDALESAHALSGRKRISYEFSKDGGAVDEEALANALDNTTDLPVDRQSLLDALKRERVVDRVTENINGKIQVAYDVDLAKLKAIAERFINPPIPHLARRQNVQGYYNPDGRWGSKQKWEWLEQGNNSMLSHIREWSRDAAYRGAITKLQDHLAKYGITNEVSRILTSASERIAGVEFEKSSRRMMEMAHGLKNYLGLAFLGFSMPTAAANGILGRITLLQAAGQEMMRVPTASRMIDGRKEIRSFGTTAELDRFLNNRNASGESGWRSDERYRFRNLMSRPMAMGLLEVMAPRTMMKYRAASSPLWRDIARLTEKYNLQSGTLTGELTQQGVDIGDWQSKAQKAMWFFQQRAEEGNNLASVMMFADDALTKMGLTDADWRMMNDQQRQAALESFTQRFDKVKTAVDALSDKDPDVRLQAAKDLLLDEVMQKAAYGRRLTQGEFTKAERSQWESFLASKWYGVLGLTLSVPALRAAQTTMGMLKAARRAEGASQKMKALAPVIFGAGAAAALLGYQAAPVAGDMGGLVDIMDMVLSAADDDAELEKMSRRQWWEKVGGDITERFTGDRAWGEKYMRALWTDGLIKTLTDVSVGNEGSVVSGLKMPGAQIVADVGRRVGRLGKNVFANDEVTLAEALTRDMELFTGTQGGRVIRAMMETATGEKQNKFGQTTIDPLTGEVKKSTPKDQIRQALFGRPWSETRAMLTRMEGGIPLDTPEQEIDYLKGVIGRTPFVKFSVKGADEEYFMGRLRGQGRAIHDREMQLVREEFGVARSEARDEIRRMIDDNETLPIPAELGGPRRMKELLAVMAQRGLSAESKRTTPAQVEKQLLGMVDDFYLVQARAQAVQEVTGGQMPMAVTDKWFKPQQMNGSQFAMYKFLERYFDVDGKTDEFRQGYEDAGR